MCFIRPPNRERNCKILDQFVGQSFQPDLWHSITCSFIYFQVQSSSKVFKKSSLLLANAFIASHQFKNLDLGTQESKFGYEDFNNKDLINDANINDDIEESLDDDSDEVLENEEQELGQGMTLRSNNIFRIISII